jgi:hypothetical protein
VSCIKSKVIWMSIGASGLEHRKDLGAEDKVGRKKEVLVALWATPADRDSQ